MITREDTPGGGVLLERGTSGAWRDAAGRTHHWGADGGALVRRLEDEPDGTVFASDHVEAKTARIVAHDAVVAETLALIMDERAPGIPARGRRAAEARVEAARADRDSAEASARSTPASGSGWFSTGRVPGRAIGSRPGGPVSAPPGSPPSRRRPRQ